MVQGHIRGASKDDIDDALGAILSMANTDFDPNPNLVPKGQYLRCKDGLAAKVFRSEIVHGKEKQIPILVMSVYHPSMKLRYECGLRPEQCRNLPKGYLD